MKRLKKRKVIVAVLLSLLLTTMQVLGYRISMHYGTSVHQSVFSQNLRMLSALQSILLAFVEVIVGAILIYAVFTWLENRKAKKWEIDGRNNILLWMAAAIILFVCWLPCLLAGYPGFYNYDAMTQVPQALYEEVQYSAHHPLLHTLLMGKIIAFGYHHGMDLNDGILLYSIFQMVVCAIAFGYMVRYILKITGRRWLAAVALGYYALFPLIPLFAMSTTKDTIFSILLQLSVIFLYEMCKDMQNFWASKWKIVRFVCTFLLMCLFRKNGIYAFICVIPFVILWGRKYWKRILLLFGATVALYVVTDKALLWGLDAVEGSPEEMLSVPMQQIARVYYDYGEDAFEPEELAIIYEGIAQEHLQNYNPFLADNIKNYFDYNVIPDNKMDYLRLWVQKGIQYPGAYIKAFLENTYQAWYPGTSIYDDPDKTNTYYFDMTMHAGGYRDSKLPGLLEFYEEIATGFSYQKLLGVRLLFSVGAMLWVALFTLSYAIYQRNRPLIVALLLVLFCCATVFLGPVSLVRYYLVLFYGFPVSVGLLLQKSV